MLSVRVTQLKPPILMLWGQQDEILPKELPGKWQAALPAPQITFKWVPRCGHSPHLEQSELVAGHMIDYLGSALGINGKAETGKTTDGPQSSNGNGVHGKEGTANGNGHAAEQEQKVVQPALVAERT